MADAVQMTLADRTSDLAGYNAESLGQVMRRPEPLVSVAEKVDGAALGMIVQNNQLGT